MIATDNRVSAKALRSWRAFSFIKGYLEESRSGGDEGKFAVYKHLLSSGHTSLPLGRILRCVIRSSARLVRPNDSCARHPFNVLRGTHKAQCVGGGTTPICSHRVGKSRLSARVQCCAISKVGRVQAAPYLLLLRNRYSIQWIPHATTATLRPLSTRSRRAMGLVADLCLMTRTVLAAGVVASFRALMRNPDQTNTYGTSTGTEQRDTACSTGNSPR